MAPESVVNPSKKVVNPTACVELAAIENLPSKVCFRLSEQRQLRLEKNTYCLVPKNARTPTIACHYLGAIVPANQPPPQRRSAESVPNVFRKVLTFSLFLSAISFVLVNCARLVNAPGA